MRTEVMMKAISLTQPWAQLVALGEKRIETRSWETKHRGPLAIHAAKGFPGWAKDTCYQPHFAAALHKAGYNTLHNLPTGVIVAMCELVQVVEMNELHVFPACKGYWYKRHEWKLDEQERAFGWYEVGRFMWLLDNVQILPKPIPAKGMQRLWEWDVPATCSLGYEMGKVVEDGAK